MCSHVHFKSAFYFDLQKMNKNIITIWNIYSFNPLHINRWHTRICLKFDEYYEWYFDQLCIKRCRNLILWNCQYYRFEIYSINQSHVHFIDNLYYNYCKLNSRSRHILWVFTRIPCFTALVIITYRLFQPTLSTPRVT